MSEEFILGHISDLHFSHGAHYRGKHTHSIEQLKNIQRIVEKTNLDKMIVTGDLTNWGDEESLLRAHSWLFDDFEVGDGTSTGLRLSPDKLGIVPGNHDAFCNTTDTGKAKSIWQRGLEKYNDVFDHHQFTPDNSCRYDWIQKGDRALFIVYVDTCYIGDPKEEKHGVKLNAQRAISKVARGEFNRKQSKQIMAWFELGMKGKLEVPNHAGEFIPSRVFATSLKIVAAHHYLFEPAGAKKERLLHLGHSEAAFTDLFSCDIDMFLCGHKHHSDITPTTYGEKLSKNGKNRHLLNIFRRILGIQMYPKQIRSKRGIFRKRSLTSLYNIITATVLKRNRASGVDDGSFVHDLIEEFKNGLADPSRFEKNVFKLLTQHGIDREDSLGKNELEDIQQRLDAAFSRDERERLIEIAKSIEKTGQNLSTRPFYHVMAGAASKTAGPTKKQRSFNTYHIQAKSGEYSIKCSRYNWDISLGEFTSPPREDHWVISDHHKFGVVE
ncbi:MAG: metallophosphoesterase [candidate division Zixibacteria bacterium]|nr:metallophosphoesterase [candidate division Zixibacteria bacterium]MDH3938116.1 metallophosphoesterase [candidate division Zixibacteria bacterium]MDH4033507.1 metallophosphoesterase [candidate division Zixibacteria bacterium]